MTTPSGVLNRGMNKREKRRRKEKLPKIVAT
jgi:hypothetical protein